MMITARTKITGLFGYPVEHSLSPLMHNTGFRHLGIDYCYLAILVHPDSLSDAVKGIRAMNFTGVNVTIPHKEKVIPFLDEVDEEARFIGAVNTILKKDGILKGFNTDGRGFMKSLEDARIDVNNRDVFILGAGGGSRAISYYISKVVSNLRIFDIDKAKLTTLVNDLKKISPNVYGEDNQKRISDSDIIVNATPLGLKSCDPLPIDIKLLKDTHIVCDLIYRDTDLLREASRLGCKTLNGLGMLLWQGVLAFEIWTGKKAPVNIMRNALLEGF